jgi:hypothetical protein
MAPPNKYKFFDDNDVRSQQLLKVKQQQIQQAVLKQQT